MSKEFFDLTHEERERLIKIHHEQKHIFDTARYIKIQQDILNKQYRENQERCTHPFPKKTYRSDNDYGCATSYSTEFYCPDCDKRWFKEGSL